MRSPTTAAGARIQRRYIPENIHFQRSGLTRFPSLDESRALQRVVILWRSYLLGEVRQNEGSWQARKQSGRQNSDELERLLNLEDVSLALQIGRVLECGILGGHVMG